MIANIGEGATPLMYACQQSNEREVLDLIARKRNSVRERDRTLKTPLHYCTENPGIGCAEAVLRSAPELLDAKDEDGYTALHLAVIAGNKSFLRFLISRGANVNALDNERHSVVHWATVCGEEEALEIVLRAGADISTADIHGGYPLHYAAQMCGPGSEMGRDPKLGLRILAILLSHGTDINVEDRDGRQPILWAASAGSADAILALVEAGASVEAADKDGLTALHCAASRGHTDCIETLVTLCGAHVDVIDGNGCTALFYAVTLGHADATRLLLGLGAEPNRQDRKGRTPAHCGAAKGQLETLRILLDYGANLWLRNVKGDFPLHEAVASGRRDLVRWLLDQRPDSVNVGNNDGRCPVHIAAINDNIDMIKILFDAQSLVNPIMRTTKGSLVTPLDAALHRGFRGCAKYLQLHGGVPFAKLTEKSSDLRGISRHVATETMYLENCAAERSSNWGTPQASSAPIFVPAQIRMGGDNAIQRIETTVERAVTRLPDDYPSDEEEKLRRRRRRRKKWEQQREGFPSEEESGGEEERPRRRQREERSRDKRDGSSSESGRRRRKAMRRKTSSTSESGEERPRKSDLEKKRKMRGKTSGGSDERKREDKSEVSTTVAEVHECAAGEATEEVAVDASAIPDDVPKITIEETLSVANLNVAESVDLNLLAPPACNGGGSGEEDLVREEVTFEEEANEPETQESATDGATKVMANEDTIEVVSVDESPDAQDTGKETEAATAVEDAACAEEEATVVDDPSAVEEVFIAEEATVESSPPNLSGPEQPALDAADEGKDDAVEQIEIVKEEMVVEKEEVYVPDAESDARVQSEDVPEGADKDTEVVPKVEKEEEEKEEEKEEDKEEEKEEDKEEGKEEDKEEEKEEDKEEEEEVEEEEEEEREEVKEEESEIGEEVIRYEYKEEEDEGEGEEEEEEEYEESAFKVLHDSRRNFTEEGSIGDESGGSTRNEDSSALPDSGIEPSPRRRQREDPHEPRASAAGRTRVPRLCNRGNRDLDDVHSVSVTQTVQNTIRKYHTERRIFYQLLELKRLQIRAGRANEQVLVKRLVDEYRRGGIVPGLKNYTGHYTFRQFEKFLYDQLRTLQSTAHALIPKLRPSDDIETLSTILRKSRVELVDDTPDNPIFCTQGTHRCHHAAHAYTGIPCAAYITKFNHHEMPKTKTTGFLPHIDQPNGAERQQPYRPVTLELSHGKEKQVISLPTDRLDKNKRYYVTFTIKGGAPLEESKSPAEDARMLRHRHAKSF